MKEYDETDAINHIKRYLKNADVENVDDNLIVEVVDCIWDAYDDLELTDIDFDEEYDEQKIFEQEQAERKKVIDYVAKQMKKLHVGRDLIGMIYDAENEYEDSIL